MTGQQKNSISKANGKWWRFENSQYGRWAVSTTPSDIFFSSLLRRRISESVNPSDSYPETPTSSTPPTRSTSKIFFLHISPSARLCLAHTAYFNSSTWTSHRSFLASLSNDLFSRDSKRGRGNSSLHSWLIVRLGRTIFREEYDTFFGHTSIFNSKNVANRLVIGGFIISFMKFIFILIFTMTDLSASNDVIKIFSRTHWEKKLDFCSFLICIPWFVYNLSTLVIPPITRLQQLERYRGNFKVSPAWRRMPTNFCLCHHFFK